MATKIYAYNRYVGNLVFSKPVVKNKSSIEKEIESKKKLKRTELLANIAAFASHIAMEEVLALRGMLDANLEYKDSKDSIELYSLVEEVERIVASINKDISNDIEASNGDLDYYKAVMAYASKKVKLPLLAIFIQYNLSFKKFFGEDRKDRKRLNLAVESLAIHVTVMIANRTIAEACRQLQEEYPEVPRILHKDKMQKISAITDKVSVKLKGSVPDYACTDSIAVKQAQTEYSKVLMSNNPTLYEEAKRTLRQKK